ncbi:MAG: hypothetical protein JRN39_06525 [Nitrososphaerota archaeon]|nr:hypothetical protein [Nitrososphaerota archaeon]MDG6940037.1 hypothetical protein [Nitrososphaerota archaeon]
MPKVKTSVSLDRELWTSFLLYCLRKYGNTRKASEELQRAIEDHIKKNPIQTEDS